VVTVQWVTHHQKLVVVQVHLAAAVVEAAQLALTPIQVQQQDHHFQEQSVHHPHLVGDTLVALV
jgi:hypothetical protein